MRSACQRQQDWDERGEDKDEYAKWRLWTFDECRSSTKPNRKYTSRWSYPAPIIQFPAELVVSPRYCSMKFIRIPSKDLSRSRHDQGISTQNDGNTNDFIPMRTPRIGFRPRHKAGNIVRQVVRINRLSVTFTAIRRFVVSSKDRSPKRIVRESFV